jgi:hypothetical protein
MELPLETFRSDGESIDWPTRCNLGEMTLVLIAGGGCVFNHVFRVLDNDFASGEG